jgi:hypothetical protein
MERNMETLQQSINSLESTLRATKPCIFFRNHVRISKTNKKKMLNIIKFIRSNLPYTMLEAQEIVFNRDKIIAEGKNISKLIQKNAEIDFEKKLNEHEVYKKAVLKSNAIINKTNESAKEIKSDAVDYSVEVLMNIENLLKELLACFSEKNIKLEKHIRNLIETTYKNRVILGGKKK